MTPCDRLRTGYSLFMPPSENTTACRRCGDEVDTMALSHWTEGENGDGHGHMGLCCDCFNLSCGKPLDVVNAGREDNGKKPLEAWTPDQIGPA